MNIGGAEKAPSQRSHTASGARGEARHEQEPASVLKNARFFRANQSRARQLSSLETYRQIRRAIDGHIAGARRLLDVGNGGVFHYDTSLAQQIVGVDLFVGRPPAGPDAHISLRQGDALALPEPDAGYDVVLVSSVFHHLVGGDADATIANVRQAVSEAYRVLEPGGRFVVMESCVSARFFALERRLFGSLRRLARTPLMRHPATLQFPPEVIADVIATRFGDTAITPIPVGHWIVQFGRRWPTLLTPARPYLFTARKA